MTRKPVVRPKVVQEPDPFTDEALSRGQQSTDYDQCPNCNAAWHGLPRKDGCLGSLADMTRVVDLRKRRQLSEDDSVLERVFGPRYRQAS